MEIRVIYHFYAICNQLIKITCCYMEHSLMSKQIRSDYDLSIQIQYLIQQLQSHITHTFPAWVTPTYYAMTYY
jgi:hypothetical protein